MNIVSLNILYWLFSTLELILMKILVTYFSINNTIFDTFEIFNIFTRSIYLPYFIWKIFVLYKSNKEFNPSFYDILTGVFDQFDIFLYYIALSGLTFGEYITYRTCTIFITEIILYIFNKSNLSIKKCISYIFILCSCLMLLIFNTDGKIKYIIACLTSSCIYSYISIIIEFNIELRSDAMLNIYWTKIISNIIGCFIGLSYENNTHLISFIINSEYSLYICIISAFIGLFANLYYFFKVYIISYYYNTITNGSIIILFIDIFRRLTIFIIGILFFHENYNNYIYMSLSLMLFGSIIGFVNYDRYDSDRNLLIHNTNNEIIDDHEINNNELYV